MKNSIFCVVHMTRKRVKGLNDSTIKEHDLLCNDSVRFSDFSISVSNTNDC